MHTWSPEQRNFSSNVEPLHSRFERAGYGYTCDSYEIVSACLSDGM